MQCTFCQLCCKLCFRVFCFLAMSQLLFLLYDCHELCVLLHHSIWSCVSTSRQCWLMQCTFWPQGSILEHNVLIVTSQPQDQISVIVWQLHNACVEVDQKLSASFCQDGIHMSQCLPMECMMLQLSCWSALADIMVYHAQSLLPACALIVAAFSCAVSHQHLPYQLTPKISGQQVLRHVHQYEMSSTRHQFGGLTMTLFCFVGLWQQPAILQTPSNHILSTGFVGSVGAIPFVSG